MEIKKIATREAYGRALAKFGAKYDLVVLDADLSKSTKTDTFLKVYPDKFINCGIAEASMMSTAAGIASCGKTVFASSFAIFAAGRAYEQVRNSIAYPGLNVKIAATHAGISVGEDGATHQAIEDLGLMRGIPGMTVINPSDAVSSEAAVEAAILHNGPVYLRFGRLATEIIYDENNFNFEIGKANMLRDGEDVTLIACGLMVPEALHASEALENIGISARVIDMHTIKPIDKDIIIKAAKETGAVITAEEHNIINGLGSAVAEVIAENCPAKMLRIGIEDRFGKSGKPAALLKEYGLTYENIINKTKEFLKK